MPRSLGSARFYAANTIRVFARDTHGQKYRSRSVGLRQRVFVDEVAFDIRGGAHAASTKFAPGLDRDAGL